jgi:hypothetical protein
LQARGQVDEAAQLLRLARDDMQRLNFPLELAWIEKLLKKMRAGQRRV